MHQSKIDRSKRSKVTSEFFTPPALVEEMLDALDFDWSDPTKTILEPSVGNGAFIEGILNRLINGLKDWQPDPVLRHKHIFENQIFAIDLMSDNIQECIERFNLDGLKHHFVCADALKYSYKFNEWEEHEDPIFEWPEQ